MLNIDDQELMSEAAWKKRRRGNVYKTYGELNLYYQIEKFGSNIQPFMVIIDHEEQIIDTIGYVLKDDFVDFLKRNK